MLKSQQLFVFNYFLTIYHVTIILVYLIHSQLKSLQQYFPIYWFVQDHDNFLQTVFLHFQLIPLQENYLNNQILMDITNIMELEYFINVITFILFIHYYFLIVYHVSILQEYLYQLKQESLQQSIHIHNHILNQYLWVSLEFNHKQLIKQIQVIQEYLSQNRHTIHLEQEYYEF